MKVTTSMKRGAGQNWCKHTDNAYGWRNHKAVRAGKRILRRRLKALIKKLMPSEY